MIGNALWRRRRAKPAGLTAGVLLAGLALTFPQSDPQTAVNNAFNQFRSPKEGKNAD
jgi:hypothetical protein